MARKSSIATLETSATEAKSMPKADFLSGLKAISDEAHELGLQYFGSRTANKAMKLYQVVEDFAGFSAKVPAGAQAVYNALVKANEPVTVEQWAKTLEETFTGKSKDTLNVIRANKTILEALGAVQEISTK